MLPLFLVLLVAQSALGAPPFIQITGRNINEVGSSSFTDAAFEVLDGGSNTFYLTNIQKIIDDIGSSSDNYYQAVAAGQAINLIAESSTGIAGDSCDYAAYLNAVAEGNARGALGVYVNRVLNNIDNINNLVVNPNGARFARGPTGGCASGGRSYNFERAWEQVLEETDVDTLGLINEQYCAAKRLANALGVRENNVAAGVTAAATGPAAQVIELAFPNVYNWLSVLASGGDPTGAGAQAKAAIQDAIRRL